MPSKVSHQTNSLGWEFHCRSLLSVESKRYDGFRNYLRDLAVAGNAERIFLSTVTRVELIFFAKATNSQSYAEQVLSLAKERISEDLTSNSFSVINNSASAWI